jgi:hypothetical protein
MLQKFIGAFHPNKNVNFVNINVHNELGQSLKRVIQIDANYKSDMQKDLEIIENIEYVENKKYDKAIFETAKAELLSSVKLSLGIYDDIANKEETTKNANLSYGQLERYVIIRPNIKYNIESGQLLIFGKKVSNNVVTEEVYPKLKKQKNTIAKEDIKKHMESSKYKMYIFSFSESNTFKMNRDMVEIA